RFLQEDPWGLAPDANPRRYVGNQPTGFTDPSGLAGLSIDDLPGNGTTDHSESGEPSGPPAQQTTGLQPPGFPQQPPSGGAPPSTPSGGNVNPVLRAAFEQHRQLLQRLPANNLPPEVVNALNNLDVALQSGNPSKILGQLLEANKVIAAFLSGQEPVK